MSLLSHWDGSFTLDMVATLWAITKCRALGSMFSPLYGYNGPLFLSLYGFNDTCVCFFFLYMFILHVSTIQDPSILLVASLRSATCSIPESQGGVSALLLWLQTDRPVTPRSS